jgi:hypothetical protein
MEAFAPHQKVSGQSFMLIKVNVWRQPTWRPKGLPIQQLLLLRTVGLRQSSLQVHQQVQDPGLYAYWFVCDTMSQVDHKSE